MCTWKHQKNRAGQRAKGEKGCGVNILEGLEGRESERLMESFVHILECYRKERSVRGPVLEDDVDKDGRKVKGLNCLCKTRGSPPKN